MPDPSQNANGFDSGRIRQSGTFSRQFTEAGTFTYICSIHEDMLPARVVVEK